MKQNEATVFLLELIRDEYKIEEIKIKKYYNLIENEKPARMMLYLILHLKSKMLQVPKDFSNGVIKEAIEGALMVLNNDPDCEFEELFAMIAIRAMHDSI
ncbi:hypothetical protein [Polaribacter atrinae]|uniref:hypothetical protein n=1 Tax=Polaribacter atrinae TaxID=1333662 RepID=UPI0024932C52|nr:hypothetical protein [Polaribacter atrinae]